LAAKKPRLRGEQLWLRTPIVEAAGVAWKLENLQRTGSFKLRGAATKLGKLPTGSHVVAASAGNHGMGIACAAATLGHRATIVVSRNATEPKRRGIFGYGAEIVVSSGGYEIAEAEARALATERGAVFVSPFDDEDVMAGNGGTLLDEIVAVRPNIRRVIVPVGGGGLAGGMIGRGVEIVGVQPAANCAMHDSLRDGRAHTTYDGGETLCEGLEGPVAERTFARCRGMSIVLVGEDEILDAVRWSFHTLGQRVEPSAAVVVAALRTGKLTSDAATVAVLTGGNLDDRLL
jgi:threonine dehydratase